MTAKKEMPSETVILALYSQAREVARTTHSHSPLHAHAVIEIQLLRKLYPWIEEEYCERHKSPYGSCGGNGEGLI
jgi:hypothetical protein